MSGIVIITGSSRGIGAATARVAAREGFDVCVNYLERADVAAQLVAEIEAIGVRAIAVQGDVSIESDVVRLFEEVDARLGTITGLVNNTGVLVGESRIDEIDVSLIERIFAVNVTSMFLCSREAIRRMSTAYGGSGGSIVNVSSLAGRQGGVARRVPYATTKGAMNTFTVGLAKEVAAEGIRVNAALPGIVESDFHIDYGGQERYRTAAKSIPFGRVGQPEEIAELIVWLLSSRASYVTGELIGLTGGR